MIKYRLINYFDVCGNSKDGWDVNDQCHECDVEFLDIPSDKEVVQKLKEIGFFKKHVRMNMISFAPYVEIFLIEQRRDNKPVCALEPIL